MPYHLWLAARSRCLLTLADGSPVLASSLRFGLGTWRPLPSNFFRQNLSSWPLKPSQSYLEVLAGTFTALLLIHATCRSAPEPMKKSSGCGGGDSQRNQPTTRDLFGFTALKRRFKCSLITLGKSIQSKSSNLFKTTTKKSSMTALSTLPTHRKQIPDMCRNFQPCPYPAPSRQRREVATKTSTRSTWYDSWPSAPMSELCLLFKLCIFTGFRG